MQAVEFPTKLEELGSGPARRLQAARGLPYWRPSNAVVSLPGSLETLNPKLP